MTKNCGIRTENLTAIFLVFVEFRLRHVSWWPEFLRLSVHWVFQAIFVKVWGTVITNLVIISLLVFEWQHKIERDAEINPTKLRGLENFRRAISWMLGTRFVNFNELALSTSIRISIDQKEKDTSSDFFYYANLILKKNK